MPQELGQHARRRCVQQIARGRSCVQSQLSAVQEVERHATQASAANNGCLLQCAEGPQYSGAYRNVCQAAITMNRSLAFILTARSHFPLWLQAPPVLQHWRWDCLPTGPALLVHQKFCLRHGACCGACTGDQ